MVFRDDSLEKIEAERQHRGGYPAGICKIFRRRMQLIRSANDKRDFYALKSLHFEKLKGKRQHQYSMRLNDQWRLVLEIETVGNKKILTVCTIEDYH